MGRDSVSPVFQQYLGRSPSASELQGFQSMIDAGTMDPMNLGLFLQSTPEYQQAQMPKMLGSYQNAVQGGANDYVNNTLQRGYDQAVGNFRAMGRPNSSGLGSQFAQVAGNVSAGLAPQYMSGLQNFAGNYLGNITGTQSGYGQGALSRNYGLQDTFRQRQWDLQDYQTHKNDFMNFYNQQYNRSRGAGLWGAVGGFAGGLLGMSGGPGGAAAGSSLGSAVGSYFGGK